MKVTELNREQLIQLKQGIIAERGPVSWGDLACADELVSDEDVFERYAGFYFTEDDFIS